MRCFIALPCPREIQENLATVQNTIKGLGGMKLVEAENIHLTLKFLGEVAEDKVGKISDELSFLNEKNKFDVKVKGLGAFPSLNRINVVWAGLEDGKKIIEIQRDVDRRLEKLGLPPDDRFHPHYTIARVKYLNEKEALRKLVTNMRDHEFGHYTVDSIKLMSSRLTPKGPEYATLRTYNLV